MVMSWTCVVLAIGMEIWGGGGEQNQKTGVPLFHDLLSIALVHAVIVPCKASHRLQSKPRLLGLLADSFFS